MPKEEIEVLKKIECDDCGHFFDESDIEYIESADKHLCEDCRSEYFYCDKCGEFLHEDNMRFIDNGAYCDDCFDEKFGTCDCCNEYVNRDSLIETIDGSYICESCYNNEYNTCSVCDGVMSCEDAIWYGDECYCENCYNEMLENLGIHKYRFSPCNFTFHNDETESSLRTNNPYVGIELEIQGWQRDDFCKKMKNEYGNEDIFYMKEDGSLNDEEGVEIVSNPMTYKFIKDTNYFKDLFEKMKEYEMNDTNNCGLHFHIDRMFCNSDEYLAVIDYIVNHFSEYFAKIGGRDFNEYSDYCKRTPDKERWGKCNYSRYYAVNFENSNTIELRFCKSTDNYLTFMNRVRMVFGIIYFAMRFKLKNLLTMSEASFIKKFDKVCKDNLGCVVIPIEDED